MIKVFGETKVSKPEWIAIDEGSTEYLKYFDASIKKEGQFRESDIQLARVLEELILLLLVTLVI